MADEPELSRGASGEWVKYLQQLLARWGYSPGSVNSEFADSTEEAVRAFQSAAGLNADGVVSTATWAALIGDAAASSSSSGSGSGSGDVPQEFVDAAPRPTCRSGPTSNATVTSKVKRTKTSAATRPKNLRSPRSVGETRRGNWHERGRHHQHGREGMVDQLT